MNQLFIFVNIIIINTSLQSIQGFENVKKIHITYPRINARFTCCCEDLSTTNKKNKTTNSQTNNTAETSQLSVDTSSLRQINVLVVDANDAGTKDCTTRTKIDHFISVTNKVWGQTSLEGIKY